MKRKITFLCFIVFFITSICACGEKADYSDEAVEVNVLDNENTVETIAATTESISDYVEPAGGTLKVHFLDVGQGDSTLIECNGEYMLVDAGPEDKGTSIRNYMKNVGVDKLKYLILTHTDADHIGSADSIVSNFNIDTIYMGNFPKENKTYESLINEINYKNYTWSTPSVGTKLTLGTASITIIAPNGTYTDPNNSSIGFLLSFGDKKFLFTGDAEEEAETDIVNNGINIDADVYQVGHHGSNTSSSLALLNAATPEYAVISCGEGNSYGHPRAETLNNFRSLGIKVYRTDEQGTIVCETDGKTLNWSCSPSETWKAGEPTTNSNSQADTSVNSTTDATDNTNVKNEQSTTTQESETMVWLSATGSKYHSINNCGKMNPDKARQVTEAEAISEGYEKCSKCW